MRKKLIGKVASARMNKSLRVEVERRFRHPMYGKIVRGRTVCHVHDEENTANEGDLVEIEECRPRSRTKRWELLRVVQSAGEVQSTLNFTGRCHDPQQFPSLCF